MTRKQLEQCLTFMAAYSADVSAEEIMERFGIIVSDTTTTEEALSAFLETNGVQLESGFEINKGIQELTKIVFIEITAKGWTKKVRIGSKVYIEHWALTNFGAQIKGDSLEDVKEISDDLWEALDSNDPYEVSRFLEIETYNENN